MIDLSITADASQAIGEVSKLQASVLNLGQAFGPVIAQQQALA